jgi:hypothetical protein
VLHERCPGWGAWHDILFAYPSLWYASRQGHGGVFPSSLFITRGFLFSKLQSYELEDIFWEFRVSSPRSPFSGCYIDFSGFFTSQVSFVQESILYTTCVTVGTSGKSDTARRRQMITRQYQIPVDNVFD